MDDAMRSLLYQAWEGVKSAVASGSREREADYHGFDVAVYHMKIQPILDELIALGYGDDLDVKHLIDEVNRHLRKAGGFGVCLRTSKIALLQSAETPEVRQGQTQHE